MNFERKGTSINCAIDHGLIKKLDQRHIIICLNIKF